MSEGVRQKGCGCSVLAAVLGVKFEPVSSDEFKAMGSIAEPLMDREREHMQTIIDDFQYFFIETASAASAPKFVMR
jgi:ClpP class serine protease